MLSRGQPSPLLCPGNCCRQWALWLWMVVLTVGQMFAGEEADPIDSIARLRQPGHWDLLAPFSLRLQGTVTGLDPSRRLVVLQEGHEAVGLYLDEFPATLKPGEHVSLTAREALPYLHPLPRLPWYPDEVSVSPEVAAPSQLPGQYLSRTRAYLVPPKSGEYQFWLSSDDSSELWLSDSERPKGSTLIAHVNGWTPPGEWDKYATQQSAKINLVGGKPYYLELRHEQRGGQSHFELAWSGPEWSRQTLPGAALRPWNNEAARGQTGVTLEVWRGDFADRVWWLGHQREYQGDLMVRGVVWSKQGPAEQFTDQELKIGLPLARDQRYRRGVVSGVVSFVGQGNSGQELELRDGSQTLRVRWSERPTKDLRPLRDRQVRVRGVPIPAVDLRGESVLSDLLAAGEEAIEALEPPRSSEPSRTLSLRQFQQEPLGLGSDEVVRAAGKIATVVDASTFWIEDRGSFQAAVSRDGANWEAFGPMLDLNLGDSTFAGLAINANSDVFEASAQYKLPSTWPSLELRNVGRFSRPGGLERNGSLLTLRGSGSQIWNLSDQFHFAAFPARQHETLEARLLELKADHPEAKTGLIFRETLESDSKFVSLIYSRSTGVALQWRQNEQGIISRSVEGPRLLPPLSLRLERTPQRLLVRTRQSGAWEAGQELVVQGRRQKEEEQVVLVDALAKPASPEAKMSLMGNDWPLLSVEAVQGEGFSEQRFDYFKVRGLVTFAGEFRGKSLLSIQDGTSGIWVGTQILDTTRLPPAGTLVEVQSTPGWRSQSYKTLTADNLLILGASRLPAPLQHPLEYALPRRGVGMWTEATGIVRGFTADQLLKIKVQGEELFAYVHGGDVRAMRGWVNRAVRLRGTVSYLNERSLVLLVPGPEQVELTEPPADAPSGPKSIASFDPTLLINKSSHQVTLAGTVLYTSPTALVLRDGDASAGVQLAETGVTSKPALGAKLTVRGFPDVQGQGLWLAESVILKEEEAESVPNPKSFEQAAEHTLATVAGELVEVEKLGSLSLLHLRVEGVNVLALWEQRNGELPVWPEGSTALLRGLKVSTTSPLLNPEFLRTPRAPSTYALLLRSTADIVAVRKPGWWVLTRTLLATGALGVLAGLAAWQMHRLRRRVAQRTAQLAEAMSQLQKETQSRATLAERNRLAGEIHDSMEQGLSALLLQLESVLKNGTCPAPVRNQLEMMRNMVTYSRAEVKHAVWDLQSPWLENSNLPGAILHMIEQLALEPNRIHFSTTGEFRPLPPRTEHHLLRIAQEAITNALKHAEATHVEVTLSYEGGTVRLAVADNGKGFQPDTPPPNEAGRFGLRSLSGRARKIDAVLSVQSSLGQGTTVSVKLTAPPHSPSP